MASVRSSMVYLKFFISFWSITPSEIITRAVPLKAFLIFVLLSNTPDIITSKETIISMGITPISMGVEASSNAKVAMLDTIIVVTSSEG